MTKLKLTINTGLCPNCVHPIMARRWGSDSLHPYCPAACLFLSTEFNICEFYENKKRKGP